MKKVYICIVLLFAVFIPVHGQENLGLCSNRSLIGVQIQTSGFKYRVEAERFVAEVMNLDMIEPEASYCIIPAAGKSERKLLVRTTIQRIGSDRIEDSLKNQAIRTGIQIGVGEVLKRLPSSQRQPVRNVTKDYTAEPKIVLRQYQVSTETFMYQGKDLLWKGQNSRVFILRVTTYPGLNTRPDLIEFVSVDPQGNSDTVGKLQPYSRVLEIPQGTSNLGHRAEEFMKYISALGALDKNSPYFEANFIPGGETLSRLKQPQ